MRTVETKLYHFEELTPDAKEAAREWWRQLEAQDFDASAVFEDFERICDTLGVSLDTHPVKLYGGGTRYEPNIYYSGFSSQGDGASWEGDYAYKPGAAKAIRAYAPTDKKLHAIADALQALQARHFYKLTASITQSGRYSHEMTMRAEVERDGREVADSDAETLQELLRDLARWVYRALETEYEWRMADEQVEDAITANQYEFTEDGERARA